MSTLTVAQAYNYARAAGFTGSSLDIVVAIAQAESGLVTDARNTAGNSPPSTDRGILQINSYYHPEYTDACCDDPTCAFAAGYTISQKGANFNPWATYQNGAYLKYMTTTLPAGIPRNPVPLAQLHEPTKDGLPDEDANDNCGETSAAWIVRDIGNEPDCDGDEIHDEVIGQGVLGGSDLLSGSQVNPKYEASLQKRGVSLSVYFGTQAQLVAKCHQIMQQPAGDVLANFGGGSQYLNKFSDPAHYGGFGHICVVAHEIAGGLQLMDPWIGGWRNYTDADLEQMIVWGYVVIATPVATGGSSSVSFVVPSGWTDDGTTMRDPSGAPVIGAMRLFVGDPNNHWDPNDTPMGPEQQVAVVEYGNPQLSHKGVVQFFKISGQLSWDGAFAGGAAWRTWNGQEENALRKALSAANGQLTLLMDQITSDKSTIGALQQQLAQAGNPVVLQHLKALLDDLGISHN